MIMVWCSRCMVATFIFIFVPCLGQTSPKLHSIADIITSNFSMDDYVDVLSNICPHLDMCTKNRSTTIETKKPICEKCSCKPTCVFQHDCCIDALWVQQDYGLDIDKHLFCHSAFLREPDSKSFIDISYYMIDRCPHDSEQRPFDIKIDNETLIEDLVLVSRRDGRYIFRNREIARCHNVTDVIRWTLSVARCSLLYSEHSGTELLKYVMNACYVISQPPGDFNVSTPNCSTNAITTCNATGLWDGKDLDLVELCRQVPASRAYSNEFVFKNIFCLFCNVRSNHSIIGKYYSPNSGKTLSDLGYILNLDLFAHDSNPSSATVNRKCPKDEIMDQYFRKCRPLRCPFETFPKDGDCYQQPFRLQISLLPLSFTIIIQEDIFPLDDNSTEDFDIQSFLSLPSLKSCKYYDHLRSHKFENLTGNLNYVIIYIEFFRTNLCGKSMLQHFLYNHTFSKYENVPISVNGYSIFNYTVQMNVPFRDWFKNKPFNRDHFKYYTPPTQAMPCSSIYLNRHDFLAVTNDTETLVSNRMRKYNWTPRVDRFVSRQYGDEFIYFICLEDYISKRIVASPNATKDIDKAKGIVTLALAILSMICIIFCIIMFTVSGQKRSVPGYVFKIALFNLLFAQATYQFGVTRTELPFLACVIIGMLVHFFWLTAVFSLNSYCVLVARNLFAINDTNQVNISAMVKLLIYIYILPGLFVGGNILYTKIVKGRIGYGDHLCYIDEAAMRGFLFAVPILLTIVVNCFVYFYIVCKTRATSVMAGRQSRDIKYAMVYFRLLLLTGVAWLFGFLNEIFSSDILHYCFIITIAGQGIFLLFAFNFANIRPAVARLRTTISNKFQKRATLSDTNG